MVTIKKKSIKRREKKIRRKRNKVEIQLLVTFYRKKERSPHFFFNVTISLHDIRACTFLFLFNNILKSLGSTATLKYSFFCYWFNKLMFETSNLRDSKKDTFVGNIMSTMSVYLLNNIFFFSIYQQKEKKKKITL